jgi:hypothetical protein
MDDTSHNVYLNKAFLSCSKRVSFNTHTHTHTQIYYIFLWIIGLRSTIKTLNSIFYRIITKIVDSKYVDIN